MAPKKPSKSPHSMSVCAPSRSHRISKPASQGSRVTRKLRQPVACASKPTLMGLPFELREQILHMTLSQPGSIHDVALDKEAIEAPSRNYCFGSAILRACKQLNEESGAMLYEDNTFDILIHSPPRGLSPRITFLSLHLDEICDKLYDRLDHAADNSSDDEYPQPSLELYEVFKRALHFSIILKGKPIGASISSDDSIDNRSAIHHLCGLFADKENLSNCTLSIKLDYGQQLFDEDDDIGVKVLEPFGFLRGLKDAEVSGVCNAYANYLVSRMKSSEPGPNLWRMTLAVNEWCENFTGDEDEEFSDSAVSALHDCNIAAFMIEREILREQGEAILRQQGRFCQSSLAELYKYDLGMNPRLVLATANRITGC